MSDGVRVSDLIEGVRPALRRCDCPRSVTSPGCEHTRALSLLLDLEDYLGRLNTSRDILAKDVDFLQKRAEAAERDRDEWKEKWSRLYVVNQGVQETKERLIAEHGLDRQRAERAEAEVARLKDHIANMVTDQIIGEILQEEKDWATVESALRDLRYRAQGFAATGAHAGEALLRLKGEFDKVNARGGELLKEIDARDEKLKVTRDEENEECAKVVEKRGREVKGAVDPKLTAAAIRARRRA